MQPAWWGLVASVGLLLVVVLALAAVLTSKQEQHPPKRENPHGDPSGPTTTTLPTAALLLRPMPPAAIGEDAARATPLAEVLRGTVGNTGDVLLFAQDGTMPKLQLSSRVRLALWNSAFTHVGILWRHPQTGVAYVWESNHAASNAHSPDLITGRVAKDGSKLVHLGDKLAHYKGYCMLHSFSPTMADLCGGWAAVYAVFDRVFAACRDYGFQNSKRWMGALAVDSTIGSTSCEEDGPRRLRLRDRLCTPGRLLCCELAVYTWHCLGVWREVGSSDPCHDHWFYLPHDFMRLRIGRVRSSTLHRLVVPQRSSGD
jgi:hypothetical protein